MQHVEHNKRRRCANKNWSDGIDIEFHETFISNKLLPLENELSTVLGHISIIQPCDFIRMWFPLWH